jgi:hypothetical protein
VRAKAARTAAVLMGRSYYRRRQEYNVRWDKRLEEQA